MDITLIKAIKGNEIHGSDNPKKTGCGINLTKPENIARYITNGPMTDLNEINCEKCKLVLAKKMIKADRKEMKNMIKEEKIRAKKGLGDENIVPLGGTQANAYLPDTGSRRPAPAAPMAPVKPVVTATTSLQKNSPYTSQPAPVPPPAPVPVPPPAPTPVQTPPPATTGFNNANFVNNDFMNSFAIQKQEPQQEAKPVQNQPAPMNNDILSQFAIPKQEPQQEAKPVQNQPAPMNNDILSQFAVPASQNNLFEEEQPKKEAAFDIDEVLAQFSIPPTSKPVDTLVTEPPKNVATNIDDAIAQFSIPAPQPVVQPEAVVEEDADDKKPFDIDDALKQFSIPFPNTSSPNVEVVGDEPKANEPFANQNVIDMENVNDVNNDVVAQQPASWDTVVDQIFSADTPVVDESAPVIEEVTAPVVDESAPAIDEVTAPVIDEIAPVIEEVTAPVGDEIAPVIEEVTASAVDEIAPVSETTVPEATVIEETIETSSTYNNEAVSPEVNKYQYTTPFEDEIPVQKQEVNENLHRYTPPVFPDEPVAVQPMQAAPIAPQQPIAPQPVQPQQQNAAPIEAQNSNENQAIPVQPQPVNPMPQQAPAFAQPAPQIIGYDPNGQPIYAYVQPQFVGYDQNGQPIFAPVQMPMVNGQPPITSFTNAPNNVPVQPMTQSFPQVAPMVAPVPPMAQPAPTVMQPSQIHLSKVDEGKLKNMPNAVASAVAKSRDKQKTNIFDMQGIEMPVIDSIEGALTQMGEDVRTKQEIIDSNTSMPVFEEYKAPPKNNYAQQSRIPEKHNEGRPLSKSDLKNLKKQEKIDAKFKKELAKRGF